MAGDGTVLIVPEKMEGKISGISGKMHKVVTVKPGMFYKTDGLEFDTVAAYNTIKPFHMNTARLSEIYNFDTPPCF